MSLEKLLSELSVDNAWQDIVNITENIPSRLAGSPSSRQMAEYARERFVEAGVESDLHEFSGLVSFPEPATVRILDPEQREIVANTLGHSGSTEGIEGELVYVGSGAESEYEGKDVRGKITLSELSYSPARHEKALIAHRRGSVAQIMMNWGDETNEAVPFGSMKSAWGNPTPETLAMEVIDLPCVGVARTEGLRLKQLCERGSARVWLNARAENAWKSLTMTSAEFNARQNQQFLLLGGHMDSWFGPQATDNAAGTACILELSRVFNRYRDELQRGLLAGLWMGHETGTMVSSSRFADVNWDRLRQSCVAYLQIDQPAMTGTSVWHLHSTDDVQPFATQTIEGMAADMPVHWARMRRTGDTSFFGVGLPTFSAIMSFTDEEIQRTALANLGWWHHSIENTIDKVDKRLLELHLRVYANWMWQLLTDRVLPYRYTPLVTRFADYLSDLNSRSMSDIDLAEPLGRVRALRERVMHLDECVVAERQRSGEDSGSGDVADLLNRTMIDLSRILIPLAYTVRGSYGQDRYGHIWQAQTIPSLGACHSLAAWPKDSEEYQVLWVAAVRARNQLTDALAEANDVVADGISTLGKQ